MERTDLVIALEEWRDAQMRVDGASARDASALDAEAVRARSRFQELSAEHMVMLLDSIHDAEARRRIAVPSTPAFHQAAKDEMAIAEEIWDSARISDQDTPKHD